MWLVLLSLLLFTKCVFRIGLKSQFFLSFNLFLLPLMGPIALFGTVYGSHCTILATF